MFLNIILEDASTTKKSKRIGILENNIFYTNFSVAWAKVENKGHIPPMLLFVLTQR